ncbi:MAG: hypothetical protein LBJ20_02005 [Candidatus Methanoplasma sp.]|jgi:hypothetical protein|nr:hypothetical protein [Candidatus Methanoplasma sp.]
MRLLRDRVLVFQKKNLAIGEFDPDAEGFYRNVMAFSFTVKKKKILRVTVRSDIPVDIAIADEGGSSIAHKQMMTDGELSVPTGGNKEMGLFIGICPGDRALVNAEIWMERQ